MAAPHCWFVTIVGVIVLLFVASVAFSGWAVNGRPMRFDPAPGNVPAPKSRSWYIEGKTRTGEPLSCSFVEFDERGDFLDFRQHRDCEARIKDMAAAGPVLLGLYCHGWKNNSQSEDVVKFNSFLAKLAATPEVAQKGFRVHGVYLSWRGNIVRPFVSKSAADAFYQDTLKNFGEPIIDPKYNRWADWLGWFPENADFFTRERAAEHLVSALPMARAILTYASAAKDYGRRLDNQVFVIGHSMGALMLERSLGQAMTGSLVMEWWDGVKSKPAQQNPALPFDLILFMNSAAPSIYAKEMRDFLEANRTAQQYYLRTDSQDAPVIISLTSTADWATGKIYPLANFLAPIRPSLKRRYTTGIFGYRGQTHPGIRQSQFYSKTPGHQPYLINHWIVPESAVAPHPNADTDQVFAANISSTSPQEPSVFLTSKAKYPAAAWRITNHSPGTPLTLAGLPLSMQHSDYWIMSCGKKLVANHGDIWSTTTMEMYAGLYRLAVHLKNAPR
jgi:hypothetical protein